MTAPAPTDLLAYVHHGDCIEWLRSLAPESVDAIVTDPPYGLGFMGKAWDALPPGRDWAEACLRVLRPGGHLLAAGGTRTVHRLTVAIEDAGFEIRDSVGWVYYSGFPKSLDVSKAIDAAAGAERPVVGSKLGRPGYSLAPDQGRNVGVVGGNSAKECQITGPATPDAARWSGWGTALKPAIEPFVLARKPLVGTVAANLLAHGTGALNIDACRLAPGDRAWVGPDDGEAPSNHGESGASTPTSFALGARVPLQTPGQRLGRWPANLYYTPKAPRKERELGTEGLPERTGAEAVERAPDSAGLANPRAGAGRTDAAVRNHHPTVKPVRLMRWLVRLVTPPGGVVCDPFLGSGTTGVAALLEGFHVIGAEQDAEYVAIAEARMAHALAHPAAWAATAPGAR